MQMAGFQLRNCRCLQKKCSLAKYLLLFSLNRIFILYCLGQQGIRQSFITEKKCNIRRLSSPFHIFLVTWKTYQKHSSSLSRTHTKEETNTKDIAIHFCWYLSPLKLRTAKVQLYFKNWEPAEYLRSSQQNYSAI